MRGQVLTLGDNLLQEQLHSLNVFTKEKLLRIKEKKSNLMKFNFSRNYDFPPEFTIDGFYKELEVVKETKLLGVMLTDNLKWAANTDFITKKAYKNMWMLRRMKLLDVEPLVMLDVYLKEIRSILVLAVPDSKAIS